MSNENLRKSSGKAAKVLRESLTRRHSRCRSRVASPEEDIKRKVSGCFSSVSYQLPDSAVKEGLKPNLFFTPTASLKERSPYKPSLQTRDVIIKDGAKAALANPLARDSDEVRMNQIQVIGTHNSYHVENAYAERPLLEKWMGVAAQDWYYSHASITDQLTYQSIRGLELDLFADSVGGMYSTPLIRRASNLSYPSEPGMALPGTKVLHVADADVTSTCYTLVGCLKEIKAWSKANGGHTLIPIMLQFKMTEPFVIALGGVAGEAWNITKIEIVDAEIRSVFKGCELITPDDVRKKGLTLEQSVLKYGWPTHKQARGKFMFLMDNEPTPGKIRNPYRANGHENLERRVIFTNSDPGEPDAAFLRRNEPSGENLKIIQDLVKKGYFVRTRSDVPIATVLQNSFAMLNDALASGAQLISTDFPSVGMAARYKSSYVARLPGSATVRCNPLNSGRSCRESDLERLH